MKRMIILPIISAAFIILFSFAGCGDIESSEAMPDKAIITESEATSQTTTTEQTTEQETTTTEGTTATAEQTTAHETTTTEQGSAKQLWILNTNTMKFHEPDCSSVEKISPQNYKEFEGTYQECITRGYSPCGVCKPHES